MGDPPTVRRRGRRGRRTGTIVRVAGERIRQLFALAESEGATTRPNRADRYVGLARRVGTRYNVRIPPEFRELYCRGCSAYWIEGRTVRTRLRDGRRTRLCLRCGRRRRVPLQGAKPSRSRVVEIPGPAGGPEADALVGPALEEDEDELTGEAEEE